MSVQTDKVQQEAGLLQPTREDPPEKLDLVLVSYGGAYIQPSALLVDCKLVQPYGKQCGVSSADEREPPVIQQFRSAYVSDRNEITMSKRYLQPYVHQEQ